MVGFDSLPTHSNKEERGIIIVNMEVKILVILNGETGKDIRNGMV